MSDGSACRMSHGTAQSVSVTSMEEFAQLISGLDQAEAIALGTVSPVALDDDGRARIVRHADLAERGGAATISRTLNFITFPSRKPGLMLLDFDTKGMSPEILGRVHAEGLDVVLGEVSPKILSCSRLWRPSTSSGVRNAVTGQIFDKAGGHLYIAVADSADIPRATKVLHQRCWLAGFGHIVGWSRWPAPRTQHHRCRRGESRASCFRRATAGRCSAAPGWARLRGLARQHPG